MIVQIVPSTGGMSAEGTLEVHVFDQCESCVVRAADMVDLRVDLWLEGAGARVGDI